MNKRLRLAKDLLADTGVILVSIDENEFAHLSLLCNQVFGEENYIADFIWKNKKGGGNDSRHVAKEHEYVLFYAKNKQLLPKLFIPMTEDYAKRYKHKDDEGRYFWDTFKRKSGKQYYPIVTPDGTTIEYDDNGNKISWLRSEARFLADIDKGDARFVKIRNNWSIQFKQRIPEGKKPRTIIDDVATTSDGSAELLAIFGKNTFDNPKPTALMRYLLAGVDKRDAVVLDFMAGSGTTGHAVLQLNAEDGGNRQFILCTNNENEIAENVTYQRISSVIDGYADVAGIPANVRYFKTDFVDKASTTDQTRIRLVARATDMIKIREETFDTVLDEPLFKIFANDDTYSAIIFEPSVLKQAKAELAKLPTNRPINVYVFSLANDSFESDFADLDRQMTLCPIPESILEVYKRIFEQGDAK